MPRLTSDRPTLTSLADACDELIVPAEPSPEFRAGLDGPDPDRMLQATNPPQHDTERPPAVPSTLPSPPSAPSLAVRSDGLIEPNALESAIGGLRLDMQALGFQLNSLTGVVSELGDTVRQIRQTQLSRADAEAKRYQEAVRLRRDFDELECQRPPACPARAAGKNGG